MSSDTTPAAKAAAAKAKRAAHDFYADSPVLSALNAKLAPQYAVLEEEWTSALYLRIAAFCARFGVTLEINTHYENGTFMWEDFWSRTVNMDLAPPAAVQRRQKRIEGRIAEYAKGIVNIEASIEGEQDERKLRKLRSMLASRQRRIEEQRTLANQTTIPMSIHPDDDSGTEDLSEQDREDFDRLFGNLHWLLCCPSPFGVENMALLSDYHADGV